MISSPPITKIPTIHPKPQKHGKINEVDSKNNKGWLLIEYFVSRENPVPNTYKETIEDDEKGAHWKEAGNNEMNIMKQFGV